MVQPHIRVDRGEGAKLETLRLLVGVVVRGERVDELLLAAVDAASCSFSPDCCLPVCPLLSLLGSEMSGPSSQPAAKQAGNHEQAPESKRAARKEGIVYAAHSARRAPCPPCVLTDWTSGSTSMTISFWWFGRWRDFRNANLNSAGGVRSPRTASSGRFPVSVCRPPTCTLRAKTGCTVS